MEALISAGAAVIVGILSLIGVMITNSRSNTKMQQEMKTSQAVTDEKINELTREVRKHNDFAERIPTLEEKMERTDEKIEELNLGIRGNNDFVRRIPVLEEKLKVTNHRLSDLEEFHKPN
mgnify:CR=1 FL=1